MLIALLYNVDEAYYLPLQLEKQTSGNTHRFYSGDSRNFRFSASTSAKSSIETKKGKSIITGNEFTDNVFYQLFQTKETKKEIIEELPTFRKKRKSSGFQVYTPGLCDSK